MWTSFAAAIFIHDPVYRLQSPGKLLDSIETWDGILEKLGGANTAYWPNQPVEIPQNVVKIHEGSSQCLKIIEKVSFNMASEASYVYILSGQKFIKSAKKGPFWRVFENLKMRHFE